MFQNQILVANKTINSITKMSFIYLYKVDTFTVSLNISVSLRNVILVLIFINITPQPANSAACFLISLVSFCDTWSCFVNDLTSPFFNLFAFFNKTISVSILDRVAKLTWTFRANAGFALQHLYLQKHVWPPPLYLAGAGVAGAGACAGAGSGGIFNSSSGHSYLPLHLFISANLLQFIGWKTVWK